MEAFRVHPASNNPECFQDKKRRAIYVRVRIDIADDIADIAEVIADDIADDIAE